MTLWRFAPRWLAMFGTLHAHTTIAVVTITVNHWRIDGIAAIALVLICARLTSHAPQHRNSDAFSSRHTSHAQARTGVEEVGA